MKKTVCLMAMLLMGAMTIQAQSNKCATDDVCNKLREQHPEIKEWEIKLGAAIKEALEENKKKGLIYGKTTGIVYDIPLVVHVVHDYGAEYLTDDEIYDAVEYWDFVYNKKNADTIDVIPNFKKYIGNPEIRLRLANLDPSGNPTKGITRRQSYMTFEGSNEAKVDLWPNNKYLNIWIINKFNADYSASTLAYSMYPSTAASMPHYDGVICRFNYIASDKTIPHEIGHSLSLAHPWGNTNNPEVACGDDGVDDTPPTYGHYNCTPSSLYDTRCATGYTDFFGTYHPNSTLAPDTANTQNIMDYSFCARMFTIGQADRMRSALMSSVAGRSNLHTPGNLTATGALLPRADLKPIADFSVDKGVFGWGGVTAERTVFLCQNSTTKFQFRNRSWNDTITDVAWTFSNSPSLASSTLISGAVTNSFKDAGWATITLEATGNNSGKTTISKQAVYVASTTAFAAGYANYFTAPSDFANWPMFNYYNNNFKWEYISTNGHPSGYGCIRYRSFDARSFPEKYSNPAEGDYDDLFTPAFDLNSVAAVSGGSGNVKLNFFTAGCLTGASNYNDSLTIFASNNCGDSWVRVTKLDFAQLINNTVQNTEFAPTNAGQWRAQTIDVPSALRSDKTFFRFRYWPATGGNNLYFDNFSITPWTTEIKHIADNKNEVKLFPNPSTGASKLCFTTGQNGTSTIIISDITGKVISKQILQNSPNTFIQHSLERSLFPSSGVYLVQLINSDQSNTQKLVIE